MKVFRAFVFLWLIGCAAALLVAQQPPPASAPPAPASAPPSAPQIAIVAPENGSFVSGPTPLKVRIEPTDAATTVTFFADGRQVCFVAHQPFECEWDAGATISEHQIRAVAALATGGRLVQTVRTKGVGF